MLKRSLIILAVLSLSSVTVLNFISAMKMKEEVANLKAEIQALKGDTDYKNFPNKYVGEHVITHYTHTGNKTASGVYPKAGRTVAVDKRFIPHGTLIYIEGIGYRIAEDTGGDIKGKRLDVFVDSKEEAIAKGVKKAKVYTLK